MAKAKNAVERKRKTKETHPIFRQEGAPSNFVLSYILSREARKTAEMRAFFRIFIRLSKSPVPQRQSGGKKNGKQVKIVLYFSAIK